MIGIASEWLTPVLDIHTVGGTAIEDEQNFRADTDFLDLGRRREITE